MTGTVVEQLVPTPPDLNCSSPEISELEDQRIEVASAVAFLSGVMMVRTFLHIWQYFIHVAHVLKTDLICALCLFLLSWDVLSWDVLWNADVNCFYDFRFQLCMFGLQLGFLSTYLSEPIVKAFTSAAAFHVTVSQLQNMLGLRLPRHTGTFSLFKVCERQWGLSNYYINL